MRRLTRPEEAESGAINVLMAVGMVVLLGFTALAVDVGVLYSERAQLHNAADAAAIATAQRCARNAADADCSTTSLLAAELTDRNALDGLNNLQSVVIDKAGGTVTVTAGAEEAGGQPNRISLFFANALGIGSAEVAARSTAAWGSPVAGRTAFPLAVSICQVENRIDGAIQRLQAHGTGANSSCGYGPSGAPVPGGFGWLTQDPGVCGGQVDLALSEGGSDPGNNEPPNCGGVLTQWANEITAGRDVVILIPVFNQVTGTGVDARYRLVAFAAFTVAGWKFSGGTTVPTAFRNTAAHVGSTVECVGSCRGIIGTFVKYVSLDEGYTLGPTHRYGATIVRLISLGAEQE